MNERDTPLLLLTDVTHLMSFQFQFNIDEVKQQDTSEPLNQTAQALLLANNRMATLLENHLLAEYGRKIVTVSIPSYFLQYVGQLLLYSSHIRLQIRRYDRFLGNYDRFSAITTVSWQLLPFLAN